MFCYNVDSEITQMTVVYSRLAELMLKVMPYKCINKNIVVM